MVLLLTDVFLLLTQVLLWIVVGLITWFVLLRALPRAFLSLLVLLLILVVLALSFVSGPPTEGVLEIIWRIISFPFTPLGLGFILLTLLLSGTKLSKIGRNLALIGLVVLALGCLPIVAYALAQELEMEGIELVRGAPALPADARRVIVLLGQGTTRPQLRPRQGTPPDGRAKVERPIPPDAYQVLSNLPIQLTEKGDLIIYAAQLYQQEVQAGNRPLIVVSAPSRFDRRRKEGESREDASEARDIQTMLTTTFGIPRDAILLDIDSMNARRSAERTRDLLVNTQKVNFGNQLLVVAKAMSMNRVFLTFAQVFDESVIVARPTDFYTLPRPARLARVAQGRDVVERELQASDFLPSAEALYISSQAMEEYLSALHYFLRGWIKPFNPPPTPIQPSPVP